jgi:hypothetical protein
MIQIDLDFYSAACGSPGGWRSAIVPLRRVMRKLLKPMYQHQRIIFQELVAAIGQAEQRQCAIENRQRALEERLGSIEQAQVRTEEGFRRTEEGFRRTEEGFQKTEAWQQKAEDKQEALYGRQDALVADVQTVMALGWDHVALLRRLAVLEDRVEQLMQERDAGIAAHHAPRLGDPANVA